MPAKKLCAFALLSCIAIPAIATTVPVKCELGLSLVQGASPRAIVLSVPGSGITLAGDHVLPPLLPWYSEGKIAIATYEKPGISLRGGKFSLDWEMYEAHTQKDLVQCAIASLEAAMRKVGEIDRIFFVGHSEGAEVLLRTYTALDDSLAAKVAMIQLTSPHLTSWKDLARFQLKSDSAFDVFERAVMEGNVRGYFRSARDYIPADYWKDAFTLPPALEILETIASRNPKLALDFHQGRRDRHVPATALEGLEAAGFSARIHFYDAGHDLSEVYGELHPRMSEAYLPFF